MEWFYIKDGEQVGPFSQEELLNKKNSGEVAPTDMVWREGMAEWQPIQQLTEFGGSGAPAPAAQAAPAGGVPGQKIDSWLWQSIVVTLLCCLPLGVVGIVFAAKVDGLVAAGDIAGAQEAADKAKKFTTIGFIVGLVVMIAYFGLILMAGLAGA